MPENVETENPHWTTDQELEQLKENAWDDGYSYGKNLAQSWMAEPTFHRMDSEKLGEGFSAWRENYVQYADNAVDSWARTVAEGPGSEEATEVCNSWDEAVWEACERTLRHAGAITDECPKKCPRCTNYLVDSETPCGICRYMHSTGETEEAIW